MEAAKLEKNLSKMAKRFGLSWGGGRIRVVVYRKSVMGTLLAFPRQEM